MRRLPCLLLAAVGLPAIAADAESWKLGGDLRGGYFESHRTARDGTRSEVEDYRLRLRLFAEHAFDERWRARARLAGRYGSEQDGHRFYLRGYAPTPTGLSSGETTVDELYLDYADPERPWSLRLGRFQTRFELLGVAAKGLDRNDSPNVDITWTDGLHYRYQLLPAWRAHLVLQHNHRKGPGGAVRAPLDFSDDGSRVALFSAVEATQPAGPVVQRVIGITWMPDALASDGRAEARRDDYVAIVARGAASWPLGDTGMRLVPGAEAGYAPNTPRAAVTGTGVSGDASPHAWQTMLSLYDIAPGHNLGVVYARVGAGWLLSGDFRGNDELAEVRYQWRFSPAWSFESRYRVREEMRLPPGAERARVDRDFYFRISGRF